jgi:hypothetical protein
MKLKVRHKHCGRDCMPGEIVRLDDLFAVAMEDAGKAVPCSPAEIVKDKQAARAAKAEHDAKKAKKAKK